MLNKLRIQVERLQVWWCRMQHVSLRWPIHGQYQCAICHRRYPVAWGEASIGAASPTLRAVYRNHHSVTIWAPSHHDSKSEVSVF